MTSVPGNRTGHRASRPWAAPVVLGFTLTVLLAGPNVPTPLYPSYERAFGFSPFLITLVFAAYAIVLIPALLVFGSASDALGRRRVLLPATAVAALGAALFAVASGPGWMFAARAAQGLALGAAQGTATAALSDTDPDRDHARAARIGSLAVVGGIALGPLLGGLLAQYAPAPLVLPYLVEAVLLVAALVATACTVPRHDASGQRWRPRRPSIPVGMRRRFVLCGVSAFVAFSASALFLTLMPSVVGQLAHSTDLALSGGVVAVMLGCAALAQLPLHKLGTRRAQVFGLALMTIGLLGVIAAARTTSLGVVLVASVVTGIGQGLTFGGSLASVSAVTPVERRGDVLSSYYVTVYLGLAVPVVGIGIVALGTGQLVAAQIFAAVIAAACLIATIAHLLDARRDRTATGRAGDPSDDAPPSGSP